MYIFFYLISIFFLLNINGKVICLGIKKLIFKYLNFFKICLRIFLCGFWFIFGRNYLIS